MRGRRLDRWFARFRARGDAKALAKVFDATAPELYRIATHLAKDLHAAEDLVQSTFLAAIEGRESWDESREVMAWLVGILARQAAYERRRRARTLEPDRLEQREVPEPGERLEAQELSAELTRAIDGIPALCREVLLEHLKQGKTPQEIARDLGRAPGTVRVQLHRALEMVRKALPAGLATGGMIAAVPTRGLSAVRAVVVSSASRIPALEGSILSAKTAIAVSGLALVLGFAGRWAFPPVDAPRVATGVVEPVEAERSEAETEPSMRLAPVPSSSTPADTRAPVVPLRRGPPRVLGRFLSPDGAPASEAYVALVGMSEGRPGDTAQEKPTDSEGTFVIEGHPGTYLVVGIRDMCLPLVRPVTLDAGTDVELEPAAFSRGERIAGRVRIHGASAPRDSVVTASNSLYESGSWLGWQGLAWEAGALRVRSRTVRTDELGRFVIEGLEPGLHEVSLYRTPESLVLRAEVEAQAPTNDLALDVDAARLILRIRGEQHRIDARIVFHKGGERGSYMRFGVDPDRDLDVLFPAGSFYTVDVDKERYESVRLELKLPAGGETLEKTVDLVRALEAK
jgi:RNA polymerase sigma-70 factor (ECF subfamily)